MSSISCILYSSIIQNLLQRFLSRLSTLTGPFPSDPEAASEKSSSTWTTSFQGSRFYSKGDNHTLVFTLCICFAFASIAHFSSLLTFNPNKGATACGAQQFRPPVQLLLMIALLTYLLYSFSGCLGRDGRTVSSAGWVVDFKL